MIVIILIYLLIENSLPLNGQINNEIANKPIEIMNSFCGEVGTTYERTATHFEFEKKKKPNWIIPI